MNTTAVTVSRARPARANCWRVRYVVTSSTATKNTMPSRLQNTSEPTVVSTNNEGALGNHRGITTQAPKNRALSNMPSGTTDIDMTSASSPPAAYIPMPAGTMVEGTVPSKPPTSPPHFSMATVTAVATTPAKTADNRTEVQSNVIPPALPTPPPGGRDHHRSIRRPAHRPRTAR